jgi:hypothetical protein
VFCVYSVLLSNDFTYSRVPGDQGGPIVFRLEKFFSAVFLGLFCSSDIVSEHFLHFVDLPSFFFFEGTHRKFIRQSVMSLSSISDECDDSFLLSLSELLST